jgi:putative sigma-54 modulation protein
MMNIDVKGVHFEISEEVRDYIDKKLKRVNYAEDLIIDLLFTLTRDSRAYKLEVNINFRWGYSSHIKVESFQILKGVDILFDKMDNKINKEKEKIQDHTG